MKKQLFTKWYVKYLILLACIGILLVVPMLRPSYMGFVGEESYLNLRLAEDPGVYDRYSFGGTFAAYEWGTPLVLSIAPGLMIEVLPLVLGVLSFILLWLIIKKLEDDPKIQKLTMVLFLLSPTFIYLFSFGNSLFIPTFLCILAFFLFMQKKFSWLSIPIVLILPMFNIILLASLILCMFFYAFYQDKNKKKLFIVLLIVALLASVFYYGNILYNAGFPERISQGETNWYDIFQKVIYDFGSSYGIGIFLLALSITGMLFLWKKKYTNLFVFFSLGSLIIFSLFRIEALIFLNIFLCVLGAFGIRSFLEKKKNSVITYILIIMVCGIVFSGISQLNYLTDAEPTRGEVEAMEYLQTRDEGAVFSDYTNGVWIAYGGHKNFVDSNYLFVDDAPERFEIMEELYYNRNLDEVNAIFDEYDIKYVWIDEQMREDIWEYDSQGLLFILQNTRDFIKLYDKDGVEIWVREDLDA
ncbi:MAG: hypothetical protein ABIJ18_00055 [archaeon]